MSAHAELESSKFPDVYSDYTYDHLLALSGFKGQDVIGIMRPDGTRTPIFKRGCAPGETDSDGPAAYKKLFTDPSRIVKHVAEDLDEWYQAQEDALDTQEMYDPNLFEACSIM
ncbi:hypothetical protein B0H19DRAFT_1069919 [Mycena capillaripes]|nr:hypothetical protein B0H19DRAFT_1069919 [Mycena capillaripes]